jgi:hypothetical protein
MVSYVLQFVWKDSLLFSYDNSYTHFVQCVEYNNGEQPRLLIPAIQNFVEGTVSMMYFVPYTEFCMVVSRDESISYDLSQLPNMSAIVSYFPLHNLL